ncbi:uncharacterized protein FIBRA_02817 [Fibroporia radiculosa]|uniref:Uncharacterized protein n=1 Tax=Fibroporia radiculosa TaxID=599839 RepID=J4GN50_9APHY|nr:uncharacterized protein FIBRA_02817 [Fibroporia radiculosa]CCM00775.1 predicted protein [Fibroporia radiculosa]
MTTQHIRNNLREELRLSDEHMDVDISIALIALITSAVRDSESTCTLEQIVRAVENADAATYLEPLTLLPLLIPCPRLGSEEIISLMNRACSAKEVIMAAMEVLENINRVLDIDDDADADAEGGTLSFPQQICRLIQIFNQSIPRLPKRKKSPSEVVRPLFSELQSIMSRAPTGNAVENRAILTAASALVTSAYGWAKSDPAFDGDEKSTITIILTTFLGAALEACAIHIEANLAQAAFKENFSRLVISSPGQDHSSRNEDVVHDVWKAGHLLDLTIDTCERNPSLGSFILLAHAPSYKFSVPILTVFFPIIIMCIRSNKILDEVISVLIRTIVPLKSHSPRSELSLDLLVPLAHLLPLVAGVHPDPSTRHQLYRLLSSVLTLAPSMFRLQLLQELLTDADSSPQMRIALVGLLREAVLEALAAPPDSAQSKQNVFASPIFLHTFAQIILRPDPPDLFTKAISADDFLDSPEPLRLVECLALYYVLLMKDVRNRTGIRDQDNLRNVRVSLLDPLRSRITIWSNDMSKEANSAHGDESATQFGILDMWLDRIFDVVDDLAHAQ